MIKTRKKSSKGRFKHAVLTVAGLSLGVGAFHGTLHAQEGVPEESQFCAVVCAFQLLSCYEGDACSTEGDWPVALQTPCHLCNQQHIFCVGRCMAKKQPVLSYDGCSPLCDQPGMECGNPDGCGGICDGPELCAFLKRRPEFWAAW